MVVAVQGWRDKGCPNTGKDFYDVTANTDCMNYGSTGYMKSSEMHNYSKCYPAGVYTDPPPQL